MSNLINLPINNLSFGNCSFGILNELYKKKYDDFLLFPMGEVNLTSFDKARDDNDFKLWLASQSTNVLETFSRKSPCFKLWHINGSENSISNKNVLFTFHELDQLTTTETNILNNQDYIFVSSNYSKQVFEDFGVTTPIEVAHLGFDSLHFSELTDNKRQSNVCTWSIMGKYEHRKRTEKTIRAWLKKFGNDPKHALNISIYNPHFSPQDNEKILMSILGGNPKPFNLNPQPYFDTLHEVNQVMNAADIFIDMSGGEAFSLPAFTGLCLGKYGVIHNNTGMKEWANNDNAFLVEPSNKISAVDNIFFRENTPTNVGNIYDYNEDDFIDQCKAAYAAWKDNRINENGRLLKDKFTWEATTNKILAALDKI